jgi:hypothetical protein
MSAAQDSKTRLRDAVLSTVLPSPGPGWPTFAELDLAAFWRRFAEVAPLHLRFGFALSIWVLGALWPRLAGCMGALPDLAPARRDELIVRASRKPLLRELLDVVKMVAALAYFDDPGVAALTRRPR